MSEVTTRPRNSATKAPPKAKAVPSPAPAAPPSQGQHQGDGPTDDELLVADTIRQQVMAIYDGRSLDLSGACDELLHATVEALELRGGAFVGFYRALALLAGATAIEIQSNPGSPAIQVLEGMRQTLDTVAASYDTHFDACEPVAEGIRAGMRQLHERPTPPIRRTEENTAHDGAYTRGQMRAVLEFIAGQALTAQRMVLFATGHYRLDFDLANQLECVSSILQYIGATADTANGEQILGDFEHWTYGPNFADLGKAGAA